MILKSALSVRCHTVVLRKRLVETIFVLCSSECQNGFLFAYIFISAAGKTRPARGMYIICLFGGAPRQCPWASTAAAIDVEVAMEYSMAVTVILPWVAMVGTTEVDTDGTAARAMATTVALAVEAPCTMESRGPCRGNPRISTVARGKTHGRPRKCHGHCRGPPPKSQIMCICAI